MTPPANTDRVFVRAPAKINLCLHVGGRRTDGFHELESLVAFTSFGDELLLERAEGLSLSVAGPFGEGLSEGDENLIMKAARNLAVQTGATSGARITLTKRLPLASGIGGGSADAAAALRGLSRLWDLDVSALELQTVAAAIGSDVPVCLASCAAWMTGRGENVQTLPQLPEISLVLVNPMVEVPTARVFGLLKERRGADRRAPLEGFADAATLVRYLKACGNDRENPAMEIAPVIGETIDEIARLPDVLLARMSGSGATCFGLVEGAEIARECERILRATHPDWWIVGTSLALNEFGAAMAL
jgi:4-diphosphocytidyl-2-C-methyl-D-erythritol kinase